MTELPNTKKLASLASLNFLLVEDNKIALILLENVVIKAGCCFTSATDGETALDLATKQSFDLIITDLGLPGISGIELTEKLRDLEKAQHKPPVPIIGLTAHADESVKKACLQAGMNEAITKPMMPDTLDKIKAAYLSSFKNAKLGFDLPDSEETLFQLEEFPLFDVESALSTMNNDMKTLKTILTSVIHEEVPKDRIAMEKAYELGDWDTIEKVAHRMKGGFVYCGTLKLVHACQYLERYHKAGYTCSLEHLYQQFIAVLDETIQVVREWLTED